MTISQLTAYNLLDTSIGTGDRMNLSLEMFFDAQTAQHRIRIVDTATRNDASRAVSEGRDADGKVPIQSFVDHVPQMIEEIVVLNRLMGVQI